MPVLLVPHLLVIYSVLGTEEPGWSHQVREMPVPPRPEGDRVPTPVPADGRSGMVVRLRSL